MNDAFGERLDRLEKLLREGPVSKLPSVRTLAAQWGVSPATVQKVLGEAHRRGWIETRPGAGIWPAGKVPTRPRPPTRTDLATVVARLADQIERGRWPGGEALPSPKVLAFEHGLHVSTLRRALAWLETDRLVVREGRRWMVRRLEGRRHRDGRPVLLCIGAADPDGGLRMGTDREWDFWREIQAEASRCALRPVIVPWDGESLEIPDSVIGAVVSTWHMTDPHPVLATLRKSRLPVAVWVENPEILPGERHRDATRLGFHDMAYGREAGQVLAEHLKTLGHRRIAWIGPFHGSLWSRNRLEGLAGGLGDGIEVHQATHDWISEWDVQNHVWSDPGIWKDIHLEGIDHRGKIGDLVRPVMEAVARDRSLRVLEPLLEGALASGATLWVAASDLVALWCLHWLAARGIEVPRDLAMAGFDDTREALRHDLTSVRFDAQAMARSMVRQILSPSGISRRMVRYQGSVVVRGSTGSPVRSRARRIR